MKQMVFQQVWNDLDYQNEINKAISIAIEPDGKDYIICLDAVINAYYDSSDEYIIKHVDIKKAWFQFPDFETELPAKYITEIEEHLKS